MESNLCNNCKFSKKDLKIRINKRRIRKSF